MSTDEEGLYDTVRITSPIVMAIRGLSGTGKTFGANSINGTAHTVFMDTHEGTSTEETLALLGNRKYKKLWKETDETKRWDYMVEFVVRVLRAHGADVSYDTVVYDVMTKKGVKKASRIDVRVNSPIKKTPLAFVLDSSSPMVTMGALKYKGDVGAHPFEFTWQQVWNYIGSLFYLITEAGADFIHTIQFKPARDKEGSIIKGEYEPAEWKTLEYNCTVSINLEQGIKLPDGRTLFDYWVFPKVMKSRWTQSGAFTKPILVCQYLTKQVILDQLRRPYYGTFWNILNEYWILLHESDKPTHKRFCKDIEKAFDSNDEATLVKTGYKHPVGDIISEETMNDLMLAIEKAAVPAEVQQELSAAAGQAVGSGVAMEDVHDAVKAGIEADKAGTPMEATPDEGEDPPAPSDDATEAPKEKPKQGQPEEISFDD